MQYTVSHHTSLLHSFPGGGLEYNSPEADLATKDFFSKFCFYIKAVNQDPSKLDQALHSLNVFLERPVTNANTATVSSSNGDSLHQVSPHPQSPVSTYS